MRIADSTVLPSIAGTEKIPTSPTGHITPAMLQALIAANILPCKIACGTISQTSTNDPVLNWIFDNTGYSWGAARTGAGVSKLTPSTPLNPAKTVYFLGFTSGEGIFPAANGQTHWSYIGTGGDAGVLFFRTGDIVSGDVDSVLTDTPFLVLVFP